MRDFNTHDINIYAEMRPIPTCPPFFMLMSSVKNQTIKIIVVSQARVHVLVDDPDASTRQLRLWIYIDHLHLIHEGERN